MGAGSEVIRRRWAVPNQGLEKMSWFVYNFRKQFIVIEDIGMQLTTDSDLSDLMLRRK